MGPSSVFVAAIAQQNKIPLSNKFSRNLGSRTVARKFSIGGLCVCTGGLDIMKLTNTPLIYSISRFSLGGLEFCLGRLSPPKPSRGGGSAWEYAKDIYTCSVDPGKVHDRVPHEKLWGVLREYGVDGRLLRQITVFLLTISVVTSLGVHCLINKPTRFMHNCTPSLLDHIYTNDNLHYLYPGLFPLDISDHLPSFLLPFNAHQSQYMGSRFFSYNSPATITRE